MQSHDCRMMHFFAEPLRRNPSIRYNAVLPVISRQRDLFQKKFPCNTAASIWGRSFPCRSNSLSIAFCWDISVEQIKNTNFFQRCRSDSLPENVVTYEGRKFKGLREIIAVVGRKTIFNDSRQGNTLSEKEVQTDIDELLRIVIPILFSNKTAVRWLISITQRA